jgi:hypothetical protein
MSVMSNAPCKSGPLQRLAARAHATPLLLLLAACSASPASLGSGIDSQESALTDPALDPNGTEDDCSDNPLLPGCPTDDGSDNCSVNPLLPGCPGA